MCTHFKEGKKNYIKIVILYIPIAKDEYKSHVYIFWYPQYIIVYYYNSLFLL